MAYGMLAGVEPVYGIYTGLWPVLVYVLLGNMPHVSMGTFAVISIMVKSAVDGQVGEGEDPSPSEIEVVTAVTFCVGLIQVVMGLLRLGSLTNLVSDAIISSFTVGASVHVATSQLKHVLGISVKSHSGAGRIVKIYIDLGRNIGDTNLVTLAISVACVAFIIVCSEVVQKKVKNYCSFPLPTQLVVMAIMTTVSYYLELSSEHGVRTIKDIGEIPLGLPSDPPYFPTSQFSLVPRVLGASLPIAVVSILIYIGLGSMFAEKHGYKVLIFTIVFPDQSSQFIKINCIQVPPNTECIAQEVSNLVGTFFLCLLMSASLCRSLDQVAALSWVQVGHCCADTCRDT